MTQEDEKKTASAAPEASTNNSAALATPLHYAYTVLAEKSDYYGDSRNVKFIGVSLSLPGACGLGAKKLPDKGDRLEMAKSSTKLKEGGVIASGRGQKGHKGMRSEVWVQRWAVADWDEVDETNTRKTKKAKKATS
jgi:hypothetical protein